MDRLLRLMTRVPPGPLVAIATIAGLWVLSGAPSAAGRVPDLEGLQVNDAIARAAHDGYFTSIVFRRAGGVAGTVVRQEPEAGLIRDRRSEIVLHVTRGVAQLPVPDVRGLSVDDARAQIDRNNLVPGDVTYEKARNKRPDQVIRTVPPAGTLVDAGSKIDIVASS
jgi:serine/threonine-protein kinase